MSKDFESRLFPKLEKIIAHFGTPFHIYDEEGIWEKCRKLKRAFDIVPGFREFFAVKALPNPKILEIMRSIQFGFDCSSIPELIMSRSVGAESGDIMFTSNDTSQEELEFSARNGGCILNLDDITLVPKVPEPFPELICFRYNPGSRRSGNSIIGNPEEAKYGVSDTQIIKAYRLAKKRGAKYFGLHTMLCSNERNYNYMVETVMMLLELVEIIAGRLKIKFQFINMGGGIGIPYRPKDREVDIEAMARKISELCQRFGRRNGYTPRLYMESGRYITGPHGVFVARCINEKHIYREYRGLDAACISSLMRPAMYHPAGGYHHISVFGKEEPRKKKLLSVVGPACENNDRFGWERNLDLSEGDIVIIHDTGAHSYAMANNYNGRLRPKELLLRSNGSVELIRREETFSDYIATLNFKTDVLVLND